MTVSAATTSDIFIPNQLIPGIVEKMQQESVIMSLAQSAPQLFNPDKNYVVFTQEPEAEYVGEGEAKSPSDFAFTPVKASLHKVQTTVRLTNEVEWADEDNRLQLMEHLLASLTRSIGRAVDYGMLHAINPLTQQVLTSLQTNALTLTANQVTATGDIQADLDALPDSVIANYQVNGIALDRAFANEIRKLRVEATGAKMYPEVNLSLQPGTLDGIRAVTSGNVGGAALGATTGVKAIIGDWSLVKWGMARQLGVERIEYGDPDGLGDLKRYNQVAFRVEAAFSWAVLDPLGFAVLKAAASVPDGGGSGSDGEDSGSDDE